MAWRRGRMHKLNFISYNEYKRVPITEETRKIFKVCMRYFYTNNGFIHPVTVFQKSDNFFSNSVKLNRLSNFWHLES